jgi:hypothetical protein
MEYRADRDISNPAVRQKIQDEAKHEENLRTLALWKESERRLDILRSISPIPLELNETTIKRWKASIRFEERAPSSYSLHPNNWFNDEFPKAERTYGQAFFGKQKIDANHPVFIPEGINKDFLACILGGSQRFGHQTIFYPPEDLWYFYDPRVDAFTPTSEAKLQIQLSNILVRCADACRTTTETSQITGEFREPKVLKAIVQRARAMHEASRSFFEGKHGKLRVANGRLIDPTKPPSYQQFVQKALAPNPEATLSIQDAFDYFREFCEQNQLSLVSRAEFKERVAESIREEFDLGIRHDVLNAIGKKSHGWRGISCLYCQPVECSRN